MKNETPALIVLTPGFPESKKDSTCLPLQQAALKEMQRLVPHIKIIVLSFQYPYRKGAYTWNGIEVYSFAGKGKGGIARAILWWQVLKKLRSIKAKYTIKGVLSFWLNECAFIGKRFARPGQLPHYCWILGQDAKKENRYVNRIRPAANELVALSDFLQAEFERNHGIRPQHVVPAGVDLSLFSKKNEEKNVDILASGSLISLKQFDIFIDAVAAIRQKHPRIKALLCGEGPEREKLQSKIHELQLQNNLVLTGELPHDEVIALMKKTKLFLHPSSYEGFSGVCLEAVTAGAQVISFTQPMKQPIPGWHVAHSKEEMIELAEELLNTTLSVSSFDGYSIEATAKKLLQLFGMEASPVV